MNQFNSYPDADGGRARADGITGTHDPVRHGPGPFVMAANTLEGNKVVSPSGEDLGTVDHIMLDVPNGRVAYAVLSFGGFLGVGKKLFAIPWSALTLDTKRECFVLGTDKEKLKAAPGFDKDHWPGMADQQWAMGIHEYYGAAPYWDDYRRDPGMDG